MRAAARLAERTRGLALDGLVVYDVQDEAARTNEPRPFPFLPTLDSRAYSRRLHENTARDVFTYKCVAGMGEQTWDDWLKEASQHYGVRWLSLVGRASSQQQGDGLSLSRAVQAAAAHHGGFVVGGVVIPERHRPGDSESARLLRKTAWGCDYFISQAVYDPAPTIRLLRDYAADCRRLGVTPRRIILTFTPCGRPETLHFMKWLGIAVPAETERVMLSAPDPLAASIAICVESLRVILATASGIGVPLGVNVESVSIRKEEIAASIDLFHALRASAATGGPPGHPI